MFGAISIFISLIVDKHDTIPVKHSAIDNDLTDVIIADELFNDDEGVQSKGRDKGLKILPVWVRLPPLLWFFTLTKG